MLSWTGALAHTAFWLTSSSHDIVYHNPNFNSQADKANPSRIAIYCVHGTADRVSAFERIAKRLLPDLPETISSINLVSFENRGRGTSIKDYAKQLSLKIQANKHQKVILMGHSRGGLVCAFFAENIAELVGVEVILGFLIASPLMGAALAMAPFSWLSDSIREMAKGSEFLKELAEKINASSKKKKKYIYYSAENDFLVQATESHLNIENQSTTVFNRHGHLSIMSSRRLVNDILAHLHALGANSPRELKISDEEDYILVEEKSYTLMDACHTLDIEIAKILQQNNSNNLNEKLKTIMTLQSMLRDISEGKPCDKYPHTRTIGDFIHAYLHEETNGIKTIDILNDLVNSSFSFFGNTPRQQCFIEKMLEDYKNTPLPSRNRQEASLHPASSTAKQI